MASTMQDSKTTFLALDVPGATSKDLSLFLGLGPEAVVGPFNSVQFLTTEKRSPTLFKISVNSREEAMAIFKDSRIRLQFWPTSDFRAPEISIVSTKSLPLWEIYEYCQQYGTVVSVIPAIEKHGIFRSFVSYATVESAVRAVTDMNKGGKSEPPQIGGKSISVAITKRKGGDFWTPSKAPEKAKGNLIDIPTNNNIAAVPGAHVTPVIPGPQTHSSSKSQTGSSKNQVNNFKSQATNSKIQTSSSKIQTSSSKIQTSSSKSQTNNTKSSGHNSHNTQSKHSAANPTKKRPPGSAEGQRATLSFPRIAKEELTLQPGEIRGIACNPRLFQTSMKTWCETAFISYETLHNLSSDSNQGTVCTSTLTWGSQLDISTFRMHYGSSFTPSGSGRQYPVLSSLTVEMRQYGDKDSAAGVLAIRNNGQLPDSCDGSLTEGINVTTRAPILSMKCLESGHLVASSGTGNGDYTLQVWDMRDQREKAEIPVAILTRKKPRSKFWFDVQRMDVCSVDTRGVINAFDLYNAVSSGQHTTTANVDCTTMTDIDQEYSFFSSCISVNGFDSTVLVGSDEHAQIARWDPRSPSDAFTSMACRRTESSSIQRKNFDPVYDIAWNPSNINEFMTVHLNTIRVWDARKMDHDACATLHQFPIPRTTWFRKARWSPHHSDCIASLTVDGLVKIWKINKFDNHAEITAGVQKPEPLFIHQAHELIVSDFSWCPYNEDVIATVAPGMLNTAGNIQVWRPRNLHDSDDFEEP